MTDETLTITTPDGDFQALVRRPSGSGPAPAVVAIQEIFGVNHTMRQVADWLAGLGYVAIVPDLFWRFEPGIVLDDRKPDDLARAFDLFPKFDVDKGVEDVAATIAAARTLSGVDGHVGAIGYCLGGLLAFLTAARTDADAVVSYYGVNINSFTGEAEKIVHPLLLHIAGEDKFVPPDAQEKIVADLKNHPQITIQRYPGRDHAFAREGGDSFHAEDAALANQRTADFLAANLKADAVLAIRIERTGGPEVLEVVDVPKPTPGAGEILVRHEAIGLNFIDIYQRTGLYKLALPATLGLEAAGTVETVGEGVTRFKAGDRVAYNGGQGAYAEFNVVKAERAVALPADVPFDIAAAVLLKGMTAEFLVRRIWPVQAGDWALVHAAAGGVGSILVQWLSHLGVRVIALTGSEEKAKVATASGAEASLVYGGEDVAAQVKALTGGKGCKISYDSVGKDTIELSLACIAKRGLIVSFGNASGPVPPLAPARLQQAGSAFLTRPTLFDYIADTKSLDDSAAALFEVVADGAVKIDIGQTFPLSKARAAHEALEGRKTTGSTVLIPPGL